MSRPRLILKKIKIASLNQQERPVFEIENDVSSDQLRVAEAGTVDLDDSELICPGYKKGGERCGTRTPIKALLGDGRGTFGDSKSLLRGWENGDVVRIRR